MWPTFKTENPVEETEVREGDMRLATLAFGFTIGFGWFVAWSAFKQTRKMRKRDTYITLCWLEFLACSALAVVAWLRLCDFIGHSFWLYLFIVTLWVLQLQFLLQIIVSRICIMLTAASQKFWLKATIAVWVAVLSVPIYCIWIPAKLQISETYIRVNWYWDYIEKCLYFLTDAVLNFIFIRVIRQRLVSRGLKRYDKLISLNIRIITVSLAFDVIIIGMLSYRNDRVSLQFHPVAFMVKLAIEMYMSRLMVKVANGTEVTRYKSPDQVSQNDFEEFYARGRGFDVRVTTQVVTCTDDMDIDCAPSRDLEHGDHKLPSLNEANLEGQLWLNHSDPLSSDGRGIARIASGAWHPELDSLETPTTRGESRASQGSDSTFKAP